MDSPSVQVNPADSADIERGSVPARRAFLLSALAAGMVSVVPEASGHSEPTASGLVPVGAVLPFAGKDAPDGWLLCDGKRYDKAEPRFARLAAVLGRAYSKQDDPPDTFRVPDL